MSRRPARRMLSASALVLTLAVAGLGSLVPAGASGGRGTTRVVSRGQSIQAALDAARPGDRVIVKAGTYAEQLTVSTSGISLIGWGAVLVPPSSPVTNICSGLAGPDTEAGICVTGTDVQLAPFVEEHAKVLSVGRRVRDVVVTGFEVRAFSGPNVALVGTANARLEGNRLRAGEAYGALSVGSKDNRISHNTITPGDALRFIGICVDDVARAVVAGNDVSGYIIGLCVQTQGADIARNTVHDNCIGVFVDPGIRASVRSNRISTNNGPCADFFLTGIGVFLQGTAGTQVRYNRIDGHTPGDFGAGLVLVDDDTPGPRATGNVVKYNAFRTNTLDILSASAGAGNVIAHNRCTTSDPTGLCD